MEADAGFRPGPGRPDGQHRQGGVDSWPEADSPQGPVDVRSIPLQAHGVARTQRWGGSGRPGRGRAARCPAARANRVALAGLWVPARSEDLNGTAGRSAYG